MQSLQSSSDVESPALDSVDCCCGGPSHPQSCYDSHSHSHSRSQQHCSAPYCSPDWGPRTVGGSESPLTRQAQTRAHGKLALGTCVQRSWRWRSGMPKRICRRAGRMATTTSRLLELVSGAWGGVWAAVSRSPGPETDLESRSELLHSGSARAAPADHPRKFHADDIGLQGRMVVSKKFRDTSKACEGATVNETHSYCPRR
jgi:hypothetical protein